MEKFEVLKVIGEGGYGIVYKCRSKDTGDIVAVKKIKHNVNGDPRKMGLREIRILTALRHPNINHLVGAFKSKDRLFLVLECVEKTLLDLLNENPKGLQCQKYRSFTYQLACALYWCHSKNIVHRDVKPENLLISDQEIVKLCDFGFARYLPTQDATIPSDEDQDSIGFSQMTVYVATRWYRPPELILRLPYGKPVDLWAVGCMIVEMATGDPLFSGDTDIDQLFQIHNATGDFTSDQTDAMLTSTKFQFVTNNGTRKSGKKLNLHLYEGILGEEMFRVLQSCVINDPNERISAEECMVHSAFELERREPPSEANNYSKLARLLNPKLNGRSKRMSMDMSKKIIEPSPIETPRPIRTKEEEMLMDAEVDFEKERIAALNKETEPKQQPAYSSSYSDFTLPSPPTPCSFKTNVQPESSSTSKFPVLQASPSLMSHSPYTLQRSYTWFKSPLYSPVNEEKESNSLTKLFNQTTFTTNNSMAMQKSSAESSLTESDLALRRNSLVQPYLLRNSTQSQINIYVSKSSNAIKWDNVINKQKKQQELTAIPLRSNNNTKKLPKANSHSFLG